MFDLNNKFKLMEQRHRELICFNFLSVPLRLCVKKSFKIPVQVGTDVREIFEMIDCFVLNAVTIFKSNHTINSFNTLHLL